MSYQFDTHCPNCFAASEQSLCFTCQFDRDAYLKNDAASHYLRPFTRLSKSYILGRVLGEGSFAIVYAAIRESDQQACAIKEYYPNALAKRGVDGIALNPKRNQDLLNSWKRRFIKEANLLRRCYETPSVESGVVRYIDLLMENNSAYLVMERLEGDTLTKLLRTQKKMPPEMIFLWLKPFLNTLEKLHNKEIYHRDISPSNIMLDAIDKPVLMDFGLAREGARDELLKSSAIGRGTFIAPEQLTGGYCDQRTDLYSLGAIIYRCLIGHTPPQVEARRQGASLLPLMSDNKTTLALQKVAHHCLELDLQSRPKNVAEIKVTLAPYWGEPVEPAILPPKKTWQLKKHFSFNSKEWSVLGIAAFLSVIVMISGFIAYQHYENQLIKSRQHDDVLFQKANTDEGLRAYLSTCILCEHKVSQAVTLVSSTDQQRLDQHLRELKRIVNQQGSSDKFYQQSCEANNTFWQRLAKNASVSMAQHLLAGCYLTGFGVKQSLQDAIYWYRQAAEQGNPLAQTNLGFLYASGYGVEQDLAAAASWYRKAAEQGSAPGQVKLASMYQYGMGVEKNETEAFSWYQKAAEQGNMTGQAQLALMYDDGLGVAKDVKQAAFWYQKAAEQGSVFGQTNLGWMYDLGVGVAQNVKLAATWYRRAADQGVADAQARLGWMYHKGIGVPQSYKDAAIWYLKAANQGVANAQANLGWMYLNGLGVNLDYKEGLDWSRKAANQGNSVGQFNLGWIYQNAKGVEQNYAMAATWYHKAAKQGDASGQYNLGWMYQNGIGVGQDNKQALVWYSKAAEQGDKEAQVNLAWMYQNGIGIQRDLETAKLWYSKAAAQNDAYALKQLEALK